MKIINWIISTIFYTFIIALCEKYNLKARYCFIIYAFSLPVLCFVFELVKALLNKMN